MTQPKLLLNFLLNAVDLTGDIRNILLLNKKSIFIPYPIQWNVKETDEYEWFLYNYG